MHTTASLETTEYNDYVHWYWIHTPFIEECQMKWHKHAATAFLLGNFGRSVGLECTVLNWFESYLADGSQYIAIGGAWSCWPVVGCGIPQGSVAGPILFTLYRLVLWKVISHFGIPFHCYTDDTQIYTKADTHSTPLATSSLSISQSVWLDEA